MIKSCNDCRLNKVCSYAVNLKKVIYAEWDLKDKERFLEIAWLALGKDCAAYKKDEERRAKDDNSISSSQNT